MIRLRPPNEHFKRFATQAKVILAVWAKFIALAFLVSFIFGPVGPLIIAALVFTVLLPIGLLVLWGMALEAELGWTDPDRWRR